MVQLLFTAYYYCPLYLTLTIESKEYSTTVVSLVFQIWCCIERETAVVALLEDGSGSGHPHPSNGFSLVDLLMDYIHLDGDSGEWSVSCHLLCVLVASRKRGRGIPGEVCVLSGEVCVCVCLNACMCVCETVKDQAEWQACAQQPKTTAM